MILWQKDKIRLIGKEITLQPLKAKEGLKIIHEFSKLIVDASPYISILTEHSKMVRGTAIAKMINEVPGFDEFIYNVVSISTGVSRELLEDHATFKELITVFQEIMRLNDWDSYWKTAVSLRVADEDSFVAWIISRISKLKKG